MKYIQDIVDECRQGMIDNISAKLGGIGKEMEINVTLLNHIKMGGEWYDGHITKIGLDNDGIWVFMRFDYEIDGQYYDIEDLSMDELFEIAVIGLNLA